MSVLVAALKKFNLWVGKQRAEVFNHGAASGVVSLVATDAENRSVKRSVTATGDITSLNVTGCVHGDEIIIEIYDDGNAWTLAKHVSIEGDEPATETSNDGMPVEWHLVCILKSGSPTMRFVN